MRIDIATLFTDMCERVLDESIIGRARVAGHLQLHTHDIRSYAQDKHRHVDDTPYGGGKGMVMQVQPIYDCYQGICQQAASKPHVIYLSPKGTVLTQAKAVQLAQMPHILLLCGHYEGVDERVLEEIVDEQISIGDYVLTGGELAALVLVDAIGRLCPGVLSEDICYTEESHYNGLLEYPHYTRPAQWLGKDVPQVLKNGHHANIEQWRREKSLEITLARRPDMLATAPLTDKDKAYLKAIQEGGVQPK